MCEVGERADFQQATRTAELDIKSRPGRFQALTAKVRQAYKSYRLWKGGGKGGSHS